MLAATLDNQPVYAIVPHDQGETLVLNVDLQTGDFAWRTAFPLLMSNAVNWLVRQTATFQATYAAGDVVHLDELTDAVRAGPSRALVARRGGVDGPGRLASGIAPRRRPAVLAGGLRRAPRAARPGGCLDAAARRLIGGLGSPREQPRSCMLRATWSIRRRATCVRVGPSRPAMAALGRVGQPPWFYLVATALFLLALEWWLYQRRWIG